jgi:hypothetical protein
MQLSPISLSLERSSSPPICNPLLVSPIYNLLVSPPFAIPSSSPSTWNSTHGRSDSLETNVAGSGSAARLDADAKTAMVMDVVQELTGAAGIHLKPLWGVLVLRVDASVAVFYVLRVTSS